MNSTALNPLEIIDFEETMEEESEVKKGLKVENLEQATWAFRKMRVLELKKKEVQAVAAAEIKRINEWVEKETGEIDASKNFFEFILMEYYRNSKKADAKFKLKTPYGSVSSRKQQPKWDYNDDALKEYLISEGLENYIKTETITSPMKSELKEAAELKHDVISDLEGNVLYNVMLKEKKDKYEDEQLVGTEFIYMDIDTGELVSEENIKYYSVAAVLKDKIIKGVVITEPEDKVTVKVEV